MALEFFEYFSGITCLILVIVALLIGVKIILNYFKYRERALLLIGLMWVLLSQTWLPPVISFFLVLMNYKPLTVQLYFIIGIGFLPIALLSWLTAFTDLLYKKKQKIILIIFTIHGVIFEILFLYFLFTDPSIVGELYKSVSFKLNIFSFTYLMSVLTTLIITGFIFSHESLKSNNPEIKLKGKILMIAFTSNLIGSIINGLILEEIIPMLICRFLLVSSIIEFYYGFFLSDWLKKWLKKKGHN